MWFAVQLDQKIFDDDYYSGDILTKTFLYFQLQTCAEVYDLLLSGDFGASGSDSAESYRQICQKFFPYATKFNLNSKDTSETPEDTIEDTTHNNSTSNNNVENNSEKITNSSPVKAEINEPEP